MSGGQISLVALAKERRANRVSQFAEAAREMKASVLIEAFNSEMRNAPSRNAQKLRYFLGHTGIPSTKGFTNRDEEHLALAIFNYQDARTPGLLLPSGGTLRILDYQVPLKSARCDQGLGKVDLLGLDSEDRLVVVELKFGDEKSTGDTPLRALLEGLSYCAVMLANQADIKKEIKERIGCVVHEGSPSLFILANDEYWSYYSNNKAAGDWKKEMTRLAGDIEAGLRISVRFLSINTAFAHGLDGGRPTLLSHPVISDAPTT